jgi:hypothetical protein
MVRRRFSVRGKSADESLAHFDHGESVREMHAFFDPNPVVRMRNLSWIGIAAALLLIAAIAYQWLGP